MDFLLEYNLFKKEKEYYDIPMNFLFYNNRIERINSICYLFKIYLKIKQNAYLKIGEIVCSMDLTLAGDFIIKDYLEEDIIQCKDFSRFLSRVNQTQYHRINKKLKEFKKTRFNKKTWIEYFEKKYMDKNLMSNEIKRMKDIREKNKDIDPLGEEIWDE